MLLSRFFMIAFLVSSVLGAPAPVWAFDSATPSYIETQSLPPQLLPPPPAEGSKAWKMQVEAVIAAQRAVSPADLKAMKDEQHPRIEQMTSAIGPSFTRERLPKTFALLDLVARGTGEVVDADKQFWHTRRPYLTDSRVKLLVDPIDSSPAYPSGHTAESRVLAEVLGMLVPDKLAALRARADAIARHRVEAGVHYPVDLEGGRMLAMLVVGSLAANDDFQDDVAVARKEIAHQKSTGQ
jgi:acid phosphatase (class A)